MSSKTKYPDPAVVKKGGAGKSPDPAVVRKLIARGVSNLQEFGYPGADEQNILTDQVYAAFFDSMLRENLGHGFDAEILSLRDTVKSALQGS